MICNAWQDRGEEKADATGLQSTFRPGTISNLTVYTYAELDPLHRSLTIRLACFGEPAFSDPAKEFNLGLQYEVQGRHSNFTSIKLRRQGNSTLWYADSALREEAFGYFELYPHDYYVGNLSIIVPGEFAAGSGNVSTSEVLVNWIVYGDPSHLFYTDVVPWGVVEKEYVFPQEKPHPRPAETTQQARFYSMVFGSWYVSKIGVMIIRKPAPEVYIIDSLLAVFLVLGSTAFLSLEREGIRGRLTIYAGLLTFSIIFYFTLMPYVPQGLSPTMPQMLLVSIIWSTAVATTISLVASYLLLLPPFKNALKRRIGQFMWVYDDSVSVIIVLFTLYLAIYFSDVQSFSGRIVMLFSVPNYLARLILVSCAPLTIRVVFDAIMHVRASKSID
jgi:hypothetical protein